MYSILDALSGEAISLHLHPAIAVGGCFALAATFVGSLYVWTIWPFTWLSGKLTESGQPIPSPYQRDLPLVILRRSLSLFFVCVFAPLFLAFMATWSTDGEGVNGVAAAAGLWRIIGVRSDGLLTALALPFLLTHILFLGSHLLNHLEGMNSVYCEPHYWRLCLSDAIWIRNQVVAPFTEEFVFRGCMVPLLTPYLGSGEFSGGIYVFTVNTLKCVTP